MAATVALSEEGLKRLDVDLAQSAGLYNRAVHL